MHVQIGQRVLCVRQTDLIRRGLLIAQFVFGAEIADFVKNGPSDADGSTGLAESVGGKPTGDLLVNGVLGRFRLIEFLLVLKHHPLGVLQTRVEGLLIALGTGNQEHGCGRQHQGE